MNTSNSVPSVRRRRRTHSAEFKAKVVAACRQSGVSIAAVALENRLNANLLRRWLVTQEREQATPVSEAIRAGPAGLIAPDAAFVPIEVDGRGIAPAQQIEIELRRGTTTVKISWPIAAAEACGAWLREWLH